MVVIAINLIVTAFGAFYFYLRCCGTFTNCLLACSCHAYAISLAFAGRFSPHGQACSWNVAVNSYKGG